MRQTQWSGAARHAPCRAALAAALGSLLVTLFLCLGPVAPDGGHHGTGHVTAVTEALSFEDCTAPVTADCPPPDRCCAPVAHGTRAVPAPGAPALSAVRHRMPSPQPPAVPGPAAADPSNRGSPDLHMLQVQRT